MAQVKQGKPAAKGAKPAAKKDDKKGAKKGKKKELAADEEGEDDLSV